MVNLLARAVHDVSEGERDPEATKTTRYQYPIGKPHIKTVYASNREIFQEQETADVASFACLSTCSIHSLDHHIQLQ